MNEILAKFKVYREIFGPKGLLLPIKTKLARGATEVQFVPRGWNHPIWLRLKTSDIATFKKIFLDLDYDFPRGKNPETIVDAGANVGFASLFFARKFPAAKIVAIEPEDSNFALLKKNTSPYSNIIPVQGAVWKENKLIDLVDPGIGHWGFQAQESAAGKRLARIQGMTVEQIMTAHGLPSIDILKVDIEGGEKELFEAASSWIGRVRTIMIELHDHLKVGCCRSFYLATKDFDFEGRKGENVFLFRKASLLEAAS